MDLKRDANLDVILSTEGFEEENTGVGIVLSAFFTDAWYNDAGGYWFDVTESLMWTFAQTFMSASVKSQYRQEVQDIVAKLEATDGFSDVEYSINYVKNVITISWTYNNTKNKVNVVV